MRKRIDSIGLLSPLIADYDAYALVFVHRHRKILTPPDLLNRIEEMSGDSIIGSLAVNVGDEQIERKI